MKYYSVDRRGVYIEGGTLELTPNPVANGNLIIEHINQMYPAGFSRHGMQYLRNPPPRNLAPDVPQLGLIDCKAALQAGNGGLLAQLLDATSAALRHSQDQLLDLLLEATRKAHYPDCPSRYQSVFAWESLDEALHFRDTHGKATDHIYELAPLRKVHQGDMRLININSTSVAAIEHLMHLYWRGETVEGGTPQWENVLELPVAVQKEVA